MKEKSLLLLSIIFIFLAFASCSDNDSNNNTTGGENDTDEVYTNKWIYQQMKGLYLWNVPNNPNYDQAPVNFYNGLLFKYRQSADGDRFSWIEEKETTQRQKAGTGSLGFEILPQNYFYQLLPGQNYTNVGFFVTYVRRGSDAQNKGLKRGNVIYAVDNVDINYTNYEDLYYHLQTASSVSLSVYGEGGTANTINNITANSAYDEENPIWLESLISSGGKKIGYIVYNQFERGDNYKYDVELIQKIDALIKGGANDLIIDLRYNPGGYVISATHLASALVPNQNTADIFLKYSYNPARNDSLTRIYGSTVNFTDKVYSTSQSIPKSNLNSLYIIATENSASASEALINGLRPYMQGKLKHIGTKTTGKDKGSWAIDKNDVRIKYTLHPLIMRVLNKNDNRETGGNYERGLTPDIEINEWDKAYELVEVTNTDIFGEPIAYPLLLPWKEGMKELGDPSEALLAVAIADITGQPLPLSVKSATTRKVSVSAPVLTTFRKPAMIVEPELIGIDN